MDTLKFPIRFTRNREIEKISEGTDDYIRQMISVCILTEPFVLPLTPDFGTADPSFSTVAPSSLMLNVNKFIPEISLVAVDTLLSETSGTVNVKFIYNR
jgi:hypothetical protein